MAMQQIALRPLATLIPYTRNSRTHSEAQVAQIAASLDAFGRVVRDRASRRATAHRLAAEQI
jgi:hypothetical protein